MRTVQAAELEKQKQRIGINLLSFSSSRLTGVGQFLKRLIEHLPRNAKAELVFFHQRGFEVEAVIQVPKGIEYTCIECPRFHSQALRVAYEQLVLPFRCTKLSVLFSPCVANPIFLRGCKTVSTIHDLTPFFVKEKYGWLQGMYVRLITRLLARYSSATVTVSENSKADLVGFLGADASKVHIIYNFVTPKGLESVVYGNYFLAVGTRQPGKNLKGVIQAFAIFRRKYDVANHRLIIVGDAGWGRMDYEELIAANDLSESVQLTGYVSEEELNNLYAGCKGVILLSFYEGFGIPPLEALSWSKPSVVSNISALPEVVGTTGIKVDPGDCEQAASALKAIAERPTDYLQGRDIQLKKFSSENQVSKFLEVLGVGISTAQEDTSNS